MGNEQTPNTDKQAGYDDANAEPGTGASSPGEPGYTEGSGVNTQDAEGDEVAQRMREDPDADPALANADPARIHDDQVTPAPETQQDG